MKQFEIIHYKSEGYILTRDIISKSGVMGYREPTLHDQQQAFDELRKRTAVDCTGCNGWGFEVVYAPNLIWVCLKCKGDAVLCAYCNGNSKTCECGEQ